MWRQASDLLEHAERIQRSFLQAAIVTLQGPVCQTARWSPPMNVVETDEDVWVMVALAGIAANLIEVQLADGSLCISGHRPVPECFSEAELHMLEIPFGRFERRLQLDGAASFSLGELRQYEGLLFIQLRKA
jgi:HSP20 family molecular chaperone IbpA